MSGPQFFQTMMGRKFFESDLPNLVRTIERLGSRCTDINDSLQEISQGMVQTDTDNIIRYLVSNGINDIHQIPHCDTCGSLTYCNCEEKQDES